MKIKNLKGWQRLCVLLSAIWLVVVIAGTIVFTISATGRLKDKLESSRAGAADMWVQASIQIVWDDPSTQFGRRGNFVPNPRTATADKAAVRDKYPDLDDATFARSWQKGYPNVNFDEVNAVYEDALSELQGIHQQGRTEVVLRTSGLGFLFWIVPFTQPRGICMTLSVKSALSFIPVSCAKKY